MEKKLRLNLFDNDTVKWEKDGRLYCLHIRRDDQPLNPRTDWDNITTMACWHRRYGLGDKLSDKEPEDFWQRLVRENVPEPEILEAAEAGKLTGIRIAKNSENGDLADIYETVQWRTVLGSGDPGESLEYEGVPRDAVVDYLMDDLTVRHCMILMEPYAEWLPLWLYDHSGITMSCGSRTGQYADRWDSGGVGWIVVLKKTVMDEVGTEYVLDDEGELMRVEHKHPDAPSTWSYLTRPLTDETWRKRAIDIMKADVEVYDQYLTGDVYGFNLYSADPVEEGEEPEWNEEDSCWGFFGSDVMENGIEDHVGNGLREAVGSGCYEQGQAVEHNCTWFSF